MENSDEEWDRLVEQGSVEPMEEDEAVWINAEEAEAFQGMLHAERMNVRSRPGEIQDEILNDPQTEVDLMEDIMLTIAHERGVDILDLDGHFALDPVEGTYRWVDHEDIAPAARMGTLGRTNKRIKRGGADGGQGHSGF